MSNEPTLTEDDIMRALEARLGRLHARQRLGIERDHEAQIFGQGLNFFHPENLAASPLLIRAALTAVGLYRRGLANAEKLLLRENEIVSARLPRAFDGFAILHLSDLHVDMCPRAMARLREMVADLAYDLCVLTGDYRGATHGSHAAALDGMAELREALRAPILAVLGNHDTILMTPGLEQMGMRVLLNECETFVRDGARIHVAGVDDAHYFRVDNIAKAGEGIPQGEFSLLLSHTPEIFRQAAHAGFDVLLAGHTHGGQICLPGGVALTLDSVLPRAYGAGAWRYHDMQGYTSVGAGSSVLPVRFNCPPEITLHRLRAA
ncbi:metallophosphoesterase [Methylosinus sp. LW3]|uniref:metallophosphoesterase n=1 Tax=Methylosinus sp. LW3 TaxID=107635 RepID=UPI0004B30EBE|nr:metallophosphoesterase [Methylosinus sp. LW3]